VPTAPDRVVIDTNVFISGVLSTTSGPARCVAAVVANGQLIATDATLKELFERLLSPKFDPYVTRARREDLLSRLAPLVEIAEVVQQVRVCRDPHDDKFLEAAVNGRADVLITGDKDLLELHPFRGIQILGPAAFLGR
jgi:putative PIN family toxin of toxin-antitoxin system